MRIYAYNDLQYKEFEFIGKTVGMNICENWELPSHYPIKSTIPYPTIVQGRKFKNISYSVYWVRESLLWLGLGLEFGIK